VPEAGLEPAQGCPYRILSSQFQFRANIYRATSCRNILVSISLVSGCARCVPMVQAQDGHSLRAYPWRSNCKALQSNRTKLSRWSQFNPMLLLSRKYIVMGETVLCILVIIGQSFEGHISFQISMNGSGQNATEPLRLTAIQSRLKFARDLCCYSCGLDASQ
jgi:hypothetical protein